MEEQLEKIYRAKSILSGGHHEKNAEYNEICKLLDIFLLNHCVHEIITDLIDIDPEKSMHIKYCEKCDTVFS